LVACNGMLSGIVVQSNFLQAWNWTN
jgi:hypothetical protein